MRLKRDPHCPLLSKLIDRMPADTSKLHLWGDCGPHFRSLQLVYWACVTLLGAITAARNFRVGTFEIDLNFFAEHHGKGCVDGRFGTLALWVKEYCSRFTINSCMRSPWEYATLNETCQVASSTSLTPLILDRNPFRTRWLTAQMV